MFSAAWLLLSVAPSALAWSVEREPVGRGPRVVTEVVRPDLILVFEFASDDDAARFEGAAGVLHFAAHALRVGEAGVVRVDLGSFAGVERVGSDTLAIWTAAPLPTEGGRRVLWLDPETLAWRTVTPPPGQVDHIVCATAAPRCAVSLTAPAPNTAPDDSAALDTADVAVPRWYAQRKDGAWAAQDDGRDDDSGDPRSLLTDVTASPDGRFLVGATRTLDVDTAAVIIHDGTLARRFSSARALRKHNKGNAAEAEVDSCVLRPEAFVTPTRLRARFLTGALEIGTPACGAAGDVVVDLLRGTVQKNDGQKTWRALPCGLEHVKAPRGALTSQCLSALDVDPRLHKGTKEAPPPPPELLVLDDDEVAVVSSSSSLRWTPRGFDPERDDEARQPATEAGGHTVVVSGAVIVRFIAGGVVVTPVPGLGGVASFEVSLAGDWQLVKLDDGSRTLLRLRRAPEPR